MQQKLCRCGDSKGTVDTKVHNLGSVLYHYVIGLVWCRTVWYDTYSIVKQLLSHFFTLTRYALVCE